MVQSLVNLSLHAITKGIENGTIRHPHLLPPKLRERVLDKAIKKGFANHPNVLALASVDFVNGMTSLTVEVRTGYDLVFLKRLAASLATKLPNGDTVGDGITILNLVVHWSSFGNQYMNPDFSAATDLIDQCPNTTSLELSLCDWKITNLERSIVSFRQLTTLKLNNCVIEDHWAEVLTNIQSVENLHLFNVHHWNRNKKGLDWILPFPLPHLKSLEVVGDRYITHFTCNKAFVDNLMGCQELRQVHLSLDQKSTDEKSLVRLATMDIALKIKIQLYVVRGNYPAEKAAVFDSSSRFKVVTIFRERMYSFELYDLDVWNRHYQTALEDVLNTCSKLTTFGIRQPRFDVSQPQRQRTSIEEKERVSAALIRFFGAVERAQQLNRLILTGNFDETVVSAVFKNCLNLMQLVISCCPALRDQHLIDWVSLGGGNLTELVVVACINVTSEGFIPILANSAKGLLRCKCSGLGQDNGERNWKTACDNHCPNAIRFP